eukprot:6879634-Pyramimonas_sp.AAC.1
MSRCAICRACICATPRTSGRSTCVDGTGISVDGMGTDVETTRVSVDGMGTGVDATRISADAIGISVDNKGVDYLDDGFHRC